MNVNDTQIVERILTDAGYDLVADAEQVRPAFRNLTLILLMKGHVHLGSVGGHCVSDDLCHP
jgi:hypothetical protein